MADMMTFPDTVEEFMEEYKLVDTEQVYTNGTELVPIFRMKQWFEHEKAQLSQEGATSDTISRQWLLECVDEGWIKFDTEKDANRFIHLVRDIAPTAQPVATDMNVGDTISRQAAIDAVNNAFDRETLLTGFVRSIAVRAIRDMPSVQSEPAIPLSWIENEIKWLKSLDNTFSEITALQISVMVKKWRDEQNETD